MELWVTENSKPSKFIVFEMNSMLNSWMLTSL